MKEKLPFALKNQNKTCVSVRYKLNYIIIEGEGIDINLSLIFINLIEPHHWCNG
jgi:hypothetical protein